MEAFDNALSVSGNEQAKAVTAVWRAETSSEFL